ncbi:MAG: alpha/beta hydrolase [Solirubrobacterales bacterium]
MFWGEQPRAAGRRRIHNALLAVALAVGIAALGAAVAPDRSAAATWAPCIVILEQFECASYTLPIDRTGQVAGDTTVRAIKLPATEGPRLGTLFVIAGGPGQPSSVMLDAMLTLFPGANRYDLIALDQRGTGFSEPLNCPRIESGAADDIADPRADRPVTQCATALGPARSGYDSAESVEDLEVVRADLGVERISLFGVSYGSKMALAYARRFPARVRSLLIDSVLPIDAPTAFDLTSVAAMRLAIERLCAGGRCKDVLPSPVTKLARLARAAKDNPLEGFLVGPKGRPKRVEISDAVIFELLFAADFNLYIYEQLPAAIEAALRDDPQPMVRLFALLEGDAGGDAAVRPHSRAATEAGWTSGQRSLTRTGKRRRQSTQKPAPRISEVSSFSNTLNLATTCEDLAAPWTRDTPVGSRQTSINAAAAALPDSAFYPFPRDTVKNNSLSSICRGWPQSPDAPALSAGPPPDVPLLALNGGLDVRTPTSWARDATAGDPRAQVVEIPHTGHSTIGTDVSGCALSLAKRFLIFNATDGKCGRDPKPVPVAPRTVQTTAALKSLAGSCRKLRARRCRAAKQVVTAGYLAFRDALDQFVVGGMSAGPGLYGGSWEFDEEFDDELLAELDAADPLPLSLSLQGMEQVPGVVVDGKVSIENYPRIAGRFSVIDLEGASYSVSIAGKMAYDQRGDKVRLAARAGRRGRVKLARGSARSSAAIGVTAKSLRLRSTFAFGAGSRFFAR